MGVENTGSGVRRARSRFCLNHLRSSVTIGKLFNDYELQSPSLSSER